MKAKAILVMAVVGLLTSACGAQTVVSSGEKRGYVVVGNLFESDTYHCTAEGERPVCQRVQEFE